MSVDFLYQSAIGRLELKLLQNLGLYRLASGYLRTRMSKRMIPGYIEKNNIDMSDFEGLEFRSFAEFFSRKRESSTFDESPDVLISPCDGLLSVYPITSEMSIPMKGSHYRICDLIPEREIAEQYNDGLCLIFRLQASDYHRFCAFDDATLVDTHFIPGQLHSVQPIACETVPVYRLNRRWWSILETEHFGKVLQIEIGAMLVGGVSFAKERGDFKRGEEFGNFELAGSTIMLLLTSEVKNSLRLYDSFDDALGGETEVPITMGKGVGTLKNEAEAEFFD